MPVAVIRRGETLDQVIAKVHGPLSVAQLKTIRSATLAANPHVTVGSSLPPGTVLVVPPLPDMAPSAAAADPVSSDVLKTLDAALGDYREDLAKKLDSVRNDLGETAKMLKSAKVRRAVEQVPGADVFVGGIEGAAKTGQNDLADALAFIRKDLDALSSDLQKLLGRLP